MTLDPADKLRDDAGAHAPAARYISSSPHAFSGDLLLKQEIPRYAWDDIFYLRVAVTTVVLVDTVAAVAVVGVGSGGVAGPLPPMLPIVGLAINT